MSDPTPEAPKDDAKAPLPDVTPPGGISRALRDEDLLDVARGEVNMEDLAQLEAATDSIDFATRRAAPEVKTRLRAILARLGEIADQIDQGVRKPAAERAPLTDEQRTRLRACLDQGLEAGERGELDVARARLEEAVRLDPDGIEGLFNLGVVCGLFAHRNVAKAEFFDDYTRDEVWVEKAKLCYDRVLELDPRHLPSLKNLATLYAMRDERDLAVELLQRVVGGEVKGDDDRALIEEARAQLAELQSI